ncbi:uncharacterized protein B0I36DRAFT_84944 [Microdochium trichocladiopsis]|uniref:Uncharacterized protein n=1 Tax=Microdochium trichocladiopsis TaxID=1682393 RepID=A0A9P8YD46_9PEZI|nr:uncharacterized protein B0I36DRAFT_84944 [Microdochium trichocladiopsis]KAH7034863.1 hypothetical protein B0I36DRAFT_84944 [Microdochium trichocladiopsis]
MCTRPIHVRARAPTRHAGLGLVASPAVMCDERDSSFVSHPKSPQRETRSSGCRGRLLILIPGNCLLSCPCFISPLLLFIFFCPCVFRLFFFHLVFSHCSLRARNHVGSVIHCCCHCYGFLFSKLLCDGQRANDWVKKRTTRKKREKHGVGDEYPGESLQKQKSPYQNSDLEGKKRIKIYGNGGAAGFSTIASCRHQA